MSARLTTKVFVSALIRHAQANGGNATVLAHGDDAAGGLLLICAEKGQVTAILERGHDYDNAMVWRPNVSQVIENKEKIQEYLERIQRTDADMWLVELDIPLAERFAADFIGSP